MDDRLDFAALEAAIEEWRKENARLRQLLTDEGIDPDLPIPPFPATLLAREREQTKALEEVLRVIVNARWTECDYNKERDYCYAHAHSFDAECPYGAAERLLGGKEKHAR